MSRSVHDFGPGTLGSAGCLIWGMRLFMIPHMVVCLLLLAQVPLSVLWAVYGRDYDAPVTAVEQTKARGKRTYWGRYTLRVGGRTLEEKVDVGEAVYRRAVESLGGGSTPAPTIRVRVIFLGPVSYKRHLYDGQGVWGHVGGAVFVSLFVGGIVGTFFYQFWVRPWREMRRFRREWERIVAEGGG